MPRVTDNLRNAQILAEFSNLEPERVDYLRNNYPDFVPQGWWDYQARGAKEMQWKMVQGFLQESWQKNFTGGTFFIVRLVLSVFDPKKLFDAAFGFEGYDDEISKPAFAPLGDMEWGYIPFQRAVLYLFENPWRARFCAECNKRFVAAEPKNKFCSDACSNENRLRQKRTWFREHGKQWRKKRKAARR